MGSLVFIGLVFLIALLGYLITPDPTPFANDQHLELGLKKPGFRQVYHRTEYPRQEKRGIFQHHAVRENE